MPIEQQYLNSLVAERLDRDRWSRKQLLSYQREQLQIALQHAVASSPYYRQSIGPLISRRTPLGELPVLTKRALMTNFDHIVTASGLLLVDIERHITGGNAGNLLFDEYVACATGGTTGERGVIVYDKRGWASNLANFLRFQRMFGVTAGSRIVGIGASNPLHISSHVLRSLNTIRADAPKIGVTTPLPEVVAALNAYQPEFVITYPSFLRRLAEEQRSGRLRIFPKKIRTIAEALTEDLRLLCKEVWGAPVVNSYSNTEAGTTGGECEHVSGIHLAEDTVVFEVTDEANNPVPAGKQGSKLLMTTLTNRVLPLVRYEVSDMVTVTDDPCECGRPHARITSIEGRREELLQLPARDGGTVTIHAGILRSPLVGTAGVRQFQIVNRPDGLSIRVSTNHDKSTEEILTVVRQEIQIALAKAGVAAGKFEVEVVNNIERVGTGDKERLVSQV